MSNGTAAPPAHPRPPADSAPQPLRIGAAADLPRVPATAAGRAGTGPRSKPARHGDGDAADADAGPAAGLSA